jgi:hemerythrin-like domain-containing protein
LEEKMATITQPLREEHKELLPQVELLRLAGDAVSGTAVSDTLRQTASDAYNFLAHHLIPHALAEDQALYPVVQRVMGATQATATMSRDHQEVGDLTSQLKALMPVLEKGSLSADQANDLRRVLYGLYSLVKVHFAKEEEVYLPLLDANLTLAEANDMFEKMETAAGEAKRHAA